MHSYIYQIGLKPFSEERLLTSDKIEVGDMSLFDYTYDIDEKSRAINIRILVDTNFRQVCSLQTRTTILFIKVDSRYGESHIMTT